VSTVVFQAIVNECSFFKDKKIEISSIYMNDPLEKCFLVKNMESGKKYKVRFATKDFRETVKSEYNALQYLKKHGIQWTPEIYLSILNGKNDILIYEYIAGDSLDKIKNSLTNKELNLIREKLIILINELHLLQGEYFGDFASHHFLNWEEYIRLKLFTHVTNGHKIGLLNNTDYQTIETAFERNLGYYKNVQSHFLHFDIKPTNIIFNREKGETNLIDFELCRFGDVNIEYSRFITYYNKPDKLYRSLFIPLAKSIPGLSYCEFIETRVFLLYNLYNLLAYYTTSYIKHGVDRNYLIQPVKDTISRLQ
jgi:serine/threonine protein kinase